MNDQIALAIAEHVQRLADAFEQSLTPLETIACIDAAGDETEDKLTIRDRFALAIVASGNGLTTGDQSAYYGSRLYPARVYDLAERLDDERRRRNAVKGIEGVDQ